MSLANFYSHLNSGTFKGFNLLCGNVYTPQTPFEVFNGQNWVEHREPINSQIFDNDPHGLSNGEGPDTWHKVNSGTEDFQAIRLMHEIEFKES